MKVWTGLEVSDTAGFCLFLLTEVNGKQTSLFSLWSQPVVPQFSDIFTPWGSCQLLGQENMELGTFFLLCSTDTQPCRRICVQFSTGHQLCCSDRFPGGQLRLPKAGMCVSMCWASLFPGLPKSFLWFIPTKLLNISSWWSRSAAELVHVENCMSNQKISLSNSSAW